MKIIITGGGKLAYFLTDILIKNKHEITLIEMEKEVCEMLATHFSTHVRVVNGDGSDLEILKQADCQSADYFIAVTGQDETNLISCQIAKKDFNVRTTVSRVNNPKNAAFFRQTGVDMIYSATQMLADIIEHDIDHENMKVVFNIKGTEKNIIEITLNEKSQACGKTLATYRLPNKTKVVLITRGDDTIVPDGETVLSGGDTMLLVCDPQDYDYIYRELVKPA